MEYLNAVLYMIAGLGAFMIGFRLMSDSIKSVSDGGLKKLFKKTSDKPLAGFGVGVAATALVQSSSVTTVMVVGFVNAGFMSLSQATAVIMGANVGSTITAQIAALESFDFINYAMALSAVGIFMNLFAKKENVKTVGLSLAGLGLLFLGMRFMSDSMSVVSQSEKVASVLGAVSNPLLLLFIGALLTAIIQSSAAVTAIVISMAGAGLTVGGGGNAVYFLILGTNIGTCATAILSAIGAGTNAKRAAFIHFAFNLFGSLIFLTVLWAWQGFSAVIMEPLFPHLTTRIAMFHTFFNIICALLFLPFVKLFVALSQKIFRGKKDGDELDERLISTPSIALGQVAIAVQRAINTSLASVNNSIQLFLGEDAIDVRENNRNLKTSLDKIDDYLIAIGAAGAGMRSELQVAAFQHILIDINRIGELADNVVKYAERANKEKIALTNDAKDEVVQMTASVNSLFTACTGYLDGGKAAVLKDLEAIEDVIDGQKKTLLSNHAQRLDAGICSPSTSSIFINLVSNLERIGDHVVQIAHTYNFE